MKRNYVGLACTTHDPAVALVDSLGQTRFAEGAERSLQVKRAMNCPPDDLYRIGRLLDEYAEPGAEIVAARTWSDQLEARLEPAMIESAQLLARGLPREEGISAAVYIGSLWGMWMEPLPRSRDQAGLNLEFRLRERDPNFEARIEWRSYDHHLTHAAAACYTSPFRDAVCAVLDGFGEGVAFAFYHYREGRLDPIPCERSVGSLGLFYTLMCGLCGFDLVEGEEWKVMGLAAYGERDDSLYGQIRGMLEIDGLTIRFAPDAAPFLEHLLEERRKPDVSPLQYANLAHTGQIVFAELATELLGNLYEQGNSPNLVLTGGCALNSSYNGQILERTPFQRLHVPSAPADDGNALGAALLAYHEDNAWSDARRGTPYLGSRLRAEACERVRKLGGLRSTCLQEQRVHDKAAELLADGKILGWVQGRAEFGPRALGNRSILADPRDPHVKERVNATVKFREEFRPFAPSILHEHGDTYFEDYQESRYMERTLRFRKEIHDQIPGVVHVDGTGRLQTVKREWNERYYDLIAAFYALTGVPMLLNTSFNVMGRPIVHGVEDALAVFFTSGIDVLVLENEIYEK